MKKSSTAAAKQSRNLYRQKLTIGLDLGDRNSWYCVVDEAGQIQREQRVRTTAKALGAGPTLRGTTHWLPHPSRFSKGGHHGCGHKLQFRFL